MENIDRPSAHVDFSSYCDPESFSLQAQGHDLTLYPSGKERLETLLALIGDAQSTLHMFYYMFQDDKAGTQVRDAIVAAAERGVDITLIVDRFGTDAPDDFFKPIVDAGGTFCVFSPKFSRRYLIRNHQKICVVDETTAMVGGFNVSEHYFDPPDCNGWCDLGVKMTGPIIDDLLRWYAQLSEYAGKDGAQYRAIRRLIKDWQPSDKSVRLTLGGPTRSPSNWARIVKRDIAKGSRLDMAMAYFSPPRSFRRLMRRLADRGKLRLIMAGKSDNATTIAAARATYGGFLRNDAEIYEFQPCKLHMKLIVIDDIVYFGSANFDHRSIRLNLEMMFRFEDQGFADRMREFMDGMTEASVHVTHDLHRERRGIWNEVKWRLGWFMVSVLDYTVTRRLNIGG